MEVYEVYQLLHLAICYFLEIICNKFFKLDGDLLETMTNYDFKVSLSDPKDQKPIYEFGKR